MPALTYSDVLEAMNELEREGLSFKDHLTSKLKQIDPSRPDDNIPYLVKAIRTQKNTGGDMDLHVSLKGIGPLCDSAGVTMDALLNGKGQIFLPYSLQSKGLIYELEKFRIESKLPFESAMEWNKRIFGSDELTSTSAKAHHHSWNRIYERSTKNLKVHKTNTKMHCEHYDIPKTMPSDEEKLASKMAKTVEPLGKALTIPILMTMAEQQGKLMGAHVKTLVHQATLWQKEAVKASTEVRENKAVIARMGKEVDKNRSELAATETLLQEERKHLDRAESNLKLVQSKFKPKNVRRREETKDKKIACLKKEHRKSVKEFKKKLVLKQTELNQTQLTVEDVRQELQKQQTTNNALKAEKITIQKRASKLRLKLEEERVQSSASSDQNLLAKIDFLENANEEMKEAVDEFMKSDKVNVWKDGKYTDEVRSTYMALMANGVATTKCNVIIETVLSNIANTTAARLPKHTLAAQMRTEAAILAKMQCGITMLESNSNNTVHIDGTKKKFREFNTVNVTTGKGESLSLGYDEMSGGTTDDYLSSTVGILQEIADLLLPESSTKLEKDKKLAELLGSIRNTMTDRHIVNKCFNDSLQAIRENYMALLQDNMDELSVDELEQLVHMNNLFCSVHVVGNCGSVAKSSLKDFEEMCGLTNTYNKGTAQTYQFLYALSKAVTFSHDYQKAGVANYWASYMQDLGLQNQIMSLKGERINVLFLLGGAAYYHRTHLSEFLREKLPQSNKLLTALLDIENKVVQCACRALGILGQLVTDPLFRAISDAKAVLDLNELWEDILSDLEQMAGNPQTLMDGNGPQCIADKVKTWAPKHQCLFESQGEELDNLTLMCIKMLCISMAVLIKRQLKDQLPGGKFHKPSPAVLEETSKCPATNLITERDFAHLDRQLKEKPNISTIAVTGTVMFLNNKTFSWLNSLEKDTRANYMETARRKAPELIKSYRQKKKNVVLALSDKMTKKQDHKEKLGKKKEENTEKLITKVSKVGGLWQSGDEMTRALTDLEGEEEFEAVADQIRLRKNICSGNIDHKKFYLSHQGKKLDISILKEQLLSIISDSSNAAVENNHVHVIDTDRVSREVEETVQAKRKELHLDPEDHPKAAKKKKPEKSLVGRKILHKWKLPDGQSKWYEGTVIGALDSEKHTECRYEVKYQNDDELYEVELKEDLRDHNLVLLM